MTIKKGFLFPLKLFSEITQKNKKLDKGDFFF